MKKLVRMMPDGAVPMYFNLDFAFKLNNRDWKGLQEVFNTLAAYEATNHIPEECTAVFAKLAAYCADEQKEMMVKVPCKIGDTVWTNFSISGSYLKRKNRPYACTVIFIGLNQSDSGGYINVQYNGSDYQFSFDFDQIGKTVFLTREAALKKQQQK